MNFFFFFKETEILVEVLSNDQMYTCVVVEHVPVPWAVRIVEGSD